METLFPIPRLCEKSEPQNKRPAALCPSAQEQRPWIFMLPRTWSPVLSSLHRKSSAVVASHALVPKF